MLKPVITILLYLFTPMLFGQSLINMKHYSVQDGLSQKNVHNFIQDDNVPVPADAAAFTLLKEQLVEVLSTLTDWNVSTDTHSIIIKLTRKVLSA